MAKESNREMTASERRSGPHRTGRTSSGTSLAGSSTLPPTMLSDPGRMLGKYQLVAEIARGGMGVVYLAMIQGPGGFSKLVVVKELKPELVEEPAFLTMFLDEARLVEEHGEKRGLLDELGLELLDHDELAEAAGPLDHREVDHAHAAASDLGNQLVLAQHPPRVGQHRRRERTTARERRAGRSSPRPVRTGPALARRHFSASLLC